MKIDLDGAKIFGSGLRLDNTKNIEADDEFAIQFVGSQQLLEALRFYYYRRRVLR